MNTILLMSALAVLACDPAEYPLHQLSSAEVALAEMAPVPTTKPVDLAICLDTSGSMRGLIDAARQNIWDIVNDLALAEPAPALRVALLTYGNNGHLAEDGWVFVQTDFTDDLDLVSEKLFALTTNGGEEYVGRVVDRAMDQLDWHASADALKLIVVAGNESADQDPVVSFRDACRKAIGTGVMVNSIYCGNPADNIAPTWREVAQLADGKFASIDHNNGTVVVATPFDDELASLSASVNETYIPYGAKGAWGCSNQRAQDNNAAGMNSAAAASRAQTKAQALYCNSSWDLVDACNAEHVRIEEIKAEDLPENMQSMTIEERVAYVNEMKEKRAAIQAKIQAISAERSTFIADEMKKQALDDSKSFDNAIRSAIRTQATQKGFRFEESTVEPAPLVAEKKEDGC